MSRIFLSSSKMTEYFGARACVVAWTIGAMHSRPNLAFHAGTKKKGNVHEATKKSKTLAPNIINDKTRLGAIPSQELSTDTYNLVSTCHPQQGSRQGQLPVECLQMAERK